MTQRFKVVANRPCYSAISGAIILKIEPSADD